MLAAVPEESAAPKKSQITASMQHSVHQVVATSAMKTDISRKCPISCHLMKEVKTGTSKKKPIIKGPVSTHGYLPDFDPKNGRSAFVWCMMSYILSSIQYVLPDQALQWVLTRP